MTFSSQTFHDAKSTNKQIVLVLDLDGSLVVGVEKVADPTHPILKQLFYIQMPSHDYIVVPGAFESIRHFFAKKKPTIRVCFFSMGRKKRNERLVKEILTRALGEEHYQLIKDEVAIFSIDNAEIHQEKYKKNLTTVLQSGEKLDSVILIDDEEQFLLSSQLANGLIISKVTHKDIARAFDKSLPYRADNLENVNHLFYAIGFLEEKLFPLFSSSDSITKKLFEIQYEKEALPFFSIKNTGFFLVSFSNDNFDLLKLQEMSESHGMPLLIKVVDKLFLFSQPKGENWELIPLSSTLLTPVTDFFPAPGTQGLKIDGTYRFLYPIEQAFLEIVDEINKCKYHTKFVNILNLELYKDKFLYRAGLKKLQEYNSELEFFGHDANKYFDYKKQKKSPADIGSIKLKYMFWKCPPPVFLTKETESSIKNNTNKKLSRGD